MFLHIFDHWRPWKQRAERSRNSHQLELCMCSEPDFYPPHHHVLQKIELKKYTTSVQDEGIGRHALPPCATIRRITINLKRKNTQNCQKFKLYGSPTTKDLKKPCSSRWVGEVKTGSQGRVVAVWHQRSGNDEGVTVVAAGGMCGPTFMCGGWKLGGIPWPQARPCSPEFQIWGKKASLLL